MTYSGVDTSMPALLHEESDPQDPRPKDSLLGPNTIKERTTTGGTTGTSTDTEETTVASDGQKSKTTSQASTPRNRSRSDLNSPRELRSPRDLRVPGDEQGCPYISTETWRYAEFWGDNCLEWLSEEELRARDEFLAREYVKVEDR